MILASQSPRRKKLLEQINLPIVVKPSSASESYDVNEQPEDIVQILALRKATQVAADLEDALVIGADTIVVHQGIILEKPESPEEAERMLTRLSGDTHKVFTGVALIKTGPEGNIQASHSFFECTQVSFGQLSRHDIKQYIQTGSPMDKAGSYGIQDDWGALFVERIEGDYYNVVGFPLYRFYKQLKKFAPEFSSVFFKLTSDGSY